MSIDPDRLAALEEERRFLLDSIRDLEREHEVGDVDEHDFTVLRDGYVARAASVMREIDDGKSALPPKAARPVWRRLLVPAVTVLVAVVLGLAVRGYAGQRLPGQTLTGGQAPDQVSTLLAQGRSQLNGDPTLAIATYRKVISIEPKNAEAHTYIAWLLVLNGRQAKDNSQVQQGIGLLQEATTFDDAYADPHCLLAVANGRFLDPPDAVTAKAQAQQCLDLNPPADMRPMVQGLIDSLG
jgi:hypothetical protein